MRKNKTVAALIIAGAFSTIAPATHAGDGCGTDTRVALPYCVEEDWEIIYNVTTGDYEELRIRNNCSRKVFIKINVGAGKPDSLAEISPYTRWTMDREFHTQEDKDLIRNITCCSALGWCG